MTQKREKYYGIVEGFFSQPLPMWTTNERVDTLRFISSNAKEINSYFYCPKQDAYVTNNWDLLYPKSKLLELKKIINYCNNNGINFIYGFNPKTGSLKNGKVATKAINKISQLQTIGCNSFALLFDDAPLAYDVVDGGLVSQSVSTIRNIVNITNNVYKNTKRDIKEFWFCSPDYCLNKETPITRELKRINKNISFIWTGDDIFVKNITLKNYKITQKVVGKERKFIWWSNYPVNDAEQSVGMFNLGAFNGPKQKLLNQLSGIMVNPMREAYFNLPFYITFSNYLLNANKCNRAYEWNQALKKLLGTRSVKISKLVNNFSQRNVVDNKTKWRTRKLDLETGRINQKWGKLFIEEVKPLVKQAKVYLEVTKKIRKNEPVSVEMIRKILFPTRIDVARYYPEIFSIVSKRLKLVPLNKKEKDILQEFSLLNKVFNCNYPGGKKLFITQTDNMRCLNASRDLVNFENEVFMNFFNNKTIDTSKKLEVLSKRQNINRFFL